MPLAFNKQIHVEIVVRGDITAGGSNGRPTYNVFHYKRAAFLGNINKVDVDTAFQAAVGAKIILALNNRWTQAHNSVRCINDALDPYLTVPHINAGGVGGDGLSSMLVGYILLRSTLRKGSYRGAKRLGPLSEADCTAGTDDIFNAAGLARMNALAAAMLGGFTDASGDIWNPVVLSRKQSQLKNNATVVVATDIAQIVVNKRLSELRIRKTASAY